MDDRKGVTLREHVAVGYDRVERFYSDEEIRDLFGDDDCLVIALLNRAQAAEREVERLHAYADKLVCGLPEGRLPADVQNLREANGKMAAEIERLRSMVRKEGRYANRECD